MCMQYSWLGTEVLIHVHDLSWYIKGKVHQYIKAVQFCCSKIITNIILQERMRLIITNGRSIAQNEIAKSMHFTNYTKYLSCLKLALITNTLSL